MFPYEIADNDNIVKWNFHALATTISIANFAIKLSVDIMHTIVKIHASSNCSYT